MNAALTQSAPTMLSSKLAGSRSSLLSRNICRMPVAHRSWVVRAQTPSDQQKVQDQGDQKMVSPGSPGANGGSVSNIEAGNISNENAERRANTPANQQDFTSIQAFDGVAPETINGRLAMIGVTSALAAEFFTGIGIKEQVATAPLSIAATFLLISFASYIPIVRGFTRKEPFANAFWSPKAENWNGRVAMVGFAALITIEALAGKITPDIYGLPHGKVNAEIVNEKVVSINRGPV
ncbi:g10655 [Coccomyxa viridis]|uniref:G10655 protein n=1 Tax=Coccomyxa viridis TaxID=1274662 RepID=A0ABP1GAQ5_9CHLO